MYCIFVIEVVCISYIVLTPYLGDLTKKDTDHASVEELDHNPQHVVLHVGKNEQSHAVAAARGTLLGEGGQDVPQEATVGAEDQTVALDDFVLALEVNSIAQLKLSIGIINGVLMQVFDT